MEMKIDEVALWSVFCFSSYRKGEQNNELFRNHNKVKA